MADISKCMGKNCEIKENCYRFTAIDSYWQSYFMQTPEKDKNGKCLEFWDNKGR